MADPFEMDIEMQQRQFKAPLIDQMEQIEDKENDNLCFICNRPETEHFKSHEDVTLHALNLALQRQESRDTDDIDFSQETKLKRSRSQQTQHAESENLIR